MSNHTCIAHDRVNIWKLSPFVTRAVALMLVGLLSALYGSKAHATTPTALATCNPCASAYELQSAAANYFNNGGKGDKPGTIVFMISLNEPISMFFLNDCPNGATQPCTSVWLPQYPGTAEQENAAAAALDNMSHSRAAKLAPVVTPPNITQMDEDPVIVGYLQTQIQAAGPFGTTWWHALVGFPVTTWYKMSDKQTRTIEDIFINPDLTIFLA